VCLNVQVSQLTDTKATEEVAEKTGPEAEQEAETGDSIKGQGLESTESEQS
jgi:hypothetical protein